jgi:hypothetical protein
VPSLPRAGDATTKFPVGTDHLSFPLASRAKIEALSDPQYEVPSGETAAAVHTELPARYSKRSVPFGWKAKASPPVLPASRVPSGASSTLPSHHDTCWPAEWDPGAW